MIRKGLIHKRVIQAIAFGISAVLVMTPVTTLAAEDGTPTAEDDSSSAPESTTPQWDSEVTNEDGSITRQQTIQNEDGSTTTVIQTEIKVEGTQTQTEETLNQEKSTTNEPITGHVENAETPVEAILVDDQGNPILDENGNTQTAAVNTYDYVENSGSNVYEYEIIDTGYTEIRTVTETVVETTETKGTEEISADDTYKVELDEESKKAKVENTTEESAELVENFINELAITSNFVIYADTFNENCHIDGNIAINKLESVSPVYDYSHGYWDAGKQEYVVPIIGYQENQQVETLKNQSTGDNYSIIIDGNNHNYGTVDGGAVIVGNNISANNLNDGSKVVSYDETKPIEEAVAQAYIEAQGITDAAAQKAISNRIKAEAAIDENLAAIADAGQALINDMKGTEVTGKEAAQAAHKVIKELSSDSVVNLVVTEQDLKDSNFIGQLNSLLILNNEVGATIIINVDANAESAELKILEPLNGNGAYAQSTGYLVWNFGSYGGTITFEKAAEGVIVAANATVNIKTTTDGRIIAKQVNQNAGQEIHYPIYSRKDVETTTTTEIKDHKENTEKITNQNGKGERTEDWSNRIYTYTKQDTPDEPEKPKTPKTPSTPETPTTPSTPESPSEPDTPTINVPEIIQEVLGAIRPAPTQEVEPEKTVLGARRGPEKAVLGARRAPATGDAANFLGYILMMFSSLGGLFSWHIFRKE